MKGDDFLSISHPQFQTRMANLNLSKRMMAAEDKLGEDVESLLQVECQREDGIFTRFTSHKVRVCVKLLWPSDLIMFRMSYP